MSGGQKPAEDDLPETIGGEPLDVWLAARCSHYRLSEAYGGKAKPDARFIKLLMAFHEKHHPWSRRLIAGSCGPRLISSRCDCRA